MLTVRSNELALEAETAVLQAMLFLAFLCTEVRASADLAAGATDLLTMLEPPAIMAALALVGADMAETVRAIPEHLAVGVPLAVQEKSNWLFRRLDDRSENRQPFFVLLLPRFKT